MCVTAKGGKVGISGSRRALAATAITSVGLTLGVGVAPSQSAAAETEGNHDPQSGPETAPADRRPDQSRETEVESISRNRREMGLPSDAATVRQIMARDDHERRPGLALTPDEAREFDARAALEAPATKFLERSSSDGRFAGIRLEQSSGTLVVYWTDADSAGEPTASLRGFGADPARVRVEIVPHSKSILDSHLERASEAMGAGSAPFLSGAYVDEPSNALVLGVPEVNAESTNRVEAFAAEYNIPAAHYIVRQVDPQEPASTPENDDNAPPVVGGHAWGASSSSTSIGVCSVGFKVTRSGYSNPFLLTAGHCMTANGYSIGRSVYHDGRYLGYTSNWSYSGNKDFALLNIADDKATPRVHQVYPDTYPVKGVNTSYVEGVWRCWVGKKDPFINCGGIREDSFTTSYGLQDAYKIALACEKGSSGGPVYQQTSSGTAYANGIISGTGSDFCIGAKWSNLPSSWGLNPVIG